MIWGQFVTDLDAPLDEVWTCLVDFKSYDKWNPMLRNVSTQVQTDAAVRFEVLQDGAGPLKLSAQITELRPPEALAWRGGSRLAVAGEHYFRLESLGRDRCRFFHGEHFSGALLPLLHRRLAKARGLYLAMNAALRQRVESVATMNREGGNA